MSHMRQSLLAGLCTFAFMTGGLPEVSPAAVAQTFDTQGTIRQIRVEGNQRIESRTIESYLLVAPGDPFSPDRIDLSLKTLFATRLFADISFARDGNDLVIRVVENPVINRVIFEGNRAIDDDKFREEIQAAPRAVFTQARVQQDVKRMLELYRQAGRFGAKVIPQYKPLEQNRVDVIFEIEEGTQTGVRAINFIGNEAFSDDRLRSEIATKQSRYWRFFTSNDNYDPGRLEFDREQLRTFYQNRGYYDFRVVSAVADLTPDQSDFYITFTVEEGKQYQFGEVKVESALNKLNPDALARLVPIREGNVYRGDRIESAIESLTFAAGVAGYAFVDIRPRLDADTESGVVNVTFEIDEGPRVYIERLNIIGNTRTLDRVIRRELRVAEGDAYNRVLLERSRNRVRALRYFKDVTIEDTAGSKPDRTIVNVTVEEQPTGELTFTGGYSSTQNFLLEFSVAQRNLLGTGRSGVARVSLSELQQNLNFQFTEPRLFDRNVSGGIDLFAVRSDFLEFSNFESTIVGTGFRLGFPLSERTSLGLRYRLQYDDVNIADQNIIIDEDGDLVAASIQDPDGTVRDPVEADVTDATDLLVDVCDPLYNNRDASCQSERADLSSIIGYSLNVSTRNDPIFPTRGYDVNFSQDVAGFGGDVQYLRTEAGTTWYRGLFRGVRASWRLSAGHIQPWGNDEGINVNNRFYRGGNNFRGFDVAGIGPREVQRTFDEDTGEEIALIRGNSLGGTFYYQSTMEVTLPNGLPEEYGIRTSWFLEAGGLGNLYDSDINDPIAFTDSSGDRVERFTETDPSLRAATGLSIDWRSPFGPLRFDFSQVIEREDYDRTESFRFSTSTSF